MNHVDNKGLPNFENPPVIEVVCGIQFEPLNQLLVPHYGLLWERFKNDYPECKEVKPLPLSIEFLGNIRELEMSVSDIPPLPRIWFRNGKKNNLIQIQRDRFMFNWTKADPNEEYPRYPSVSETFKKHYKEFENLIEEMQLGSIRPIQLELTYVNHIYQGQGWDEINDIEKIFPDFSWKASGDRFLPNLENINWRTTFLLPDKIGRLHLWISNGYIKKVDSNAVRMDLTVRGFHDQNQNIWDWFNVAREWIVKGFVDLTSQEIQQKIWGRKQ